MDERFDAIVIGGGQAGLAMGRELARRGLRYLILEASPLIGASWRSRWDSLTLFTPARYSALPGLPFPGDADHHPHRDEVVRYLGAYVRALDLRLALDEPVRNVRPLDDGHLEVTTDYARYLAPNVIVATGPFQRPRVPPIAELLPSSVYQVHSADYRAPDQLPDGPVLVVGGGSSGVQIAAELAASRPTTLAVGSKLRRLPTHLFGRSIFEWLDRSGAMSVAVSSRLGRRASRRELLIGDGPRHVERDLGVRLVGRAVGADGASILTAGGTAVDASAVVWATGYRSEYPWLCAPVFGPNGTIVHERGVTRVPGLYFVGLSWQHTRGSALLGWVGRDAEYVGERVAAA